MLLFSKLRRFVLIDGQGRRAKLVQFIVDLHAEAYPVVTHILCRQARRPPKLIGWDAVTSLDHSRGQIKVKDLEDCTLPEEAWLRDSVFMSDIDDSLILDLDNRCTARANGLLLKEDSGKLILSAIDTSLFAILRRITRGHFSYVPATHVHDWTKIEFLRGEPLAVKCGLPYPHQITQLPAGEIAMLVNQLPYMHAAELLMFLPDALAINTLEAMSARRRLQVFEELDKDRCACLLELMAPDLAADLLGTLKTDTMKEFLDRLPKLQSERIVQLLCYPENTVGGVMTNDIVFAPERLTVAEAREALRERLKAPDFVYLIFIVDDEVTKRQRGIVPLRELLTRDDDETLAEIMDSNVPTLDAMDPAEGAAFKVIESQLAALPVVGSQGQLLGAVTVDAAVLLAAPLAWGSQAPRIFS